MVVNRSKKRCSDANPVPNQGKNKKKKGGREKVKKRGKTSRGIGSGAPQLVRLPDIELEGLETTPDCSTARALPAGALLAHQDVDASLTKTANAFRTCK